MNKYDIIEAIAKEGGLSTKDAAVIVNTVFESMKSAILRGERIEIRGFGSFSTRHYKSYMGRNPKTREQILVKPKRLPYFKPSREIKRLLNEE